MVKLKKNEDYKIMTFKIYEISRKFKINYLEYIFNILKH